MMTLSSLADIGEAISANLPLDMILHRIVVALTQLIACDAVSIGLLDKQQNVIQLHSAGNHLESDVIKRVGLTLPIAEFPTIQHILSTAEMLYLPDVTDSPLWRLDGFPAEFNQVKAFVGIPLKIDQDIIGVLFVDYYTPNPLNDELRYSLVAYARLIVSAIQNRWQRDQLGRAEERYRLIAGLTSEAVYEYTLNEPTINWSEGIDHLLRYEPGKFPRTRDAWINAIHPDDRERVKIALDHALRQQAAFKEEYRIRRSDGVYCVVMDRATRIIDPGNRPTAPVRLIGAISDMTQTYELADALLDSETRYRTVFERALDAIFVTDAEANFVDANPTAEALTGYDFSTLLAMSLYDLAAPEQASDYRQTFALLQQQDELAARETQLRRKDGSSVFVEMWGTALGDSIYQIVVRDVSARYLIEQQSAQRAAELMALSDVNRVMAAGGDLNEMLKRVLPDAMSALDVTMGCIYLCDEHTATLHLVASQGYSSSPDSILSMNAIERGRPTDDLTLVRIGDSIHAANIISLQVPLVANRHVLGLVIFSAPSSRAFTQAEVRLMDIIGRQLGIGIENVRLLENLGRMVQQRTTALTATETRYRSLIEQVPGVVYTARLIHSGFSFISAGTENLFGLSSMEMMKQGISLLNLIHAEDMQWVAQRAQHAVETGEDFDAQYRVTYKVNTQRERWVHHRARFIHAENGETFWLGLLTDVSELKELDRLKNQFVSTVTHELRTPLTAIKLRAATLNNYYDRLSDEQRLDAVRRISFQSDILASLIEDVLRLAKLDAGITDREIEAINIIEIGKNVIEELKPAVEAANLTLYESWQESKCLVQIDLTDLVIIWRNLIGNAVKYTPSGCVKVWIGHIQVDETSKIVESSLPADLMENLPGVQPGLWAVGIVKDTGKGLSEYDQTHLFTRFFRGEAALSSVPGSGLGLSLVKELLDDYGGHISLNSKPGEGTLFAFWLPPATAESGKTQESKDTQ